MIILQTTAESFSDKDRQLIATLAQRLTGSTPQAQSKMESCLVNIQRRMEATSCSTFEEYSLILEQSSDELAHFISALTIHTTSWFREMPHFERLKQIASSVAMLFQDGQRTEPFRILSAGCSTGEEGYSAALILEEVRHTYPLFQYTVEGWDIDPVSVAKANQAVFNANLINEIPSHFHRWVLIGTGKTKGFFTLDKKLRERCTFKRQSLIGSLPSASNYHYDVVFCRNVLIYFNQETVQKVIRNLVNHLMHGGHLCLGHSEGVQAEIFGLKSMGNTTYRKQQANAISGVVAQIFSKQDLKCPDMILIGASTGGTEVLLKMLHHMPRPCPPILVVQHMAINFARSFAERLAQSAHLNLGEPKNKDILQPNHLYMSLDDYHLGVKRRGQFYHVDTSLDPPMHGVRPSVDYLFQSVARSTPFSTVAAVVLTGMGKDGAKGLSELRERGAMTFVQDEASSTVFGMPKEAISLGAAGFVGNPDTIREQLLRALATPR